MDGGEDHRNLVHMKEGSRSICYTWVVRLKSGCSLRPSLRGTEENDMTSGTGELCDDLKDCRQILFGKAVVRCANDVVGGIR